MAITYCGHAEMVLSVLACELEIEEEEVEAGIVNALAHRLYAVFNLRRDASWDTLAQAVRKEIGTARGFIREQD